MTDGFSSAPLTVDGVTVEPKWDWSPGYRILVAAELRRATKGDLTPEETENRYIAWYAAEHGLCLAAARAKVKGGVGR